MEERKGRGLQGPRVSFLRRCTTAIGAVLLFLGFAIAVYWFRSVADVNAMDLGVSLWAGRSATEARLKVVAEAMLQEGPLTAWLAGQPLANGLQPADDDPPQRWKGLAAVAEGLTAEEARARLTASWVRRLASDEEACRELVRSLMKQNGEGTVTRAAVAEQLATRYRQALGAVLVEWLEIELPVAEVETLLIANDLRLTSGGTFSAAGEGKETGSGELGVFAAALHQGVTAFITRALASGRLVQAISDDLGHESAREAILEGVQRDYAGRWMWTLMAAIFLTAAVAAIVSGFFYMWNFYRPPDDQARTVREFAALARTRNRREHQLLRWYVLVVSGCMLLGWMLPDPGPAFLAGPLDEFSRLYGLALRGATRILNVFAWGAIGALLFAAGTSFLTDTKDDDHLNRQLGTLRFAFHTSTFVLVAAVLEMYALFQWPSAFMGEAGSALVRNGALTASLAVGAIFSMLLLLIYVPGANVLVREANHRKRDAANRLRRAGATPDDADDNPVERIDAMLKQHGFDGPVTQQIARFAQLFAPLLIAPLAEIVGLLE
jgi:hypothetical protein